MRLEQAKTTAKIGLVLVLATAFLIVVFRLHLPAWEACKADGNTNVTCVLTLKWWTFKRFWGIG